MSTHPLNPTAVIAGAGPGGSVAALLLARQGFDVTVLERTPVPRRSAGAGLLLQPNGLAVLYGLGVRDRLEAKAQRISQATVRDGDGRPIVSLDLPDFGDGLDHALAVHRSHLMDVLHDALAEEPAITMIGSAEVLAASPHGDLWYSCDDDDVRHVVADLVVGADGIRSVVREGGDFGDRTRHTARFYVRGLTNAQPDGPHGEFWTSVGLFGWAPLGDGSSYFYADVTAAESARAVAADDNAALIEIWRRAVPAASALIDSIDPATPLILTETRTVQTARFSDGRLALLGDAAHAMAPTLGQGANSALVDAAVLAIELAAGGDAATALTRYDAIRRPAVHKVQREAHRLASLAAIRSDAGRAVRDNAVRLAGRLRDSSTPFKAWMQCDPARLLAAVSDLSGTSVLHHA